LVRNIHSGDNTGASRCCHFRGAFVRTIAYVDGYNLFFGCLKNTPYKWLDIHALLAHILRIQDPASELMGVKYFTAPIKARLASRGEAATQAQETYRRALQTNPAIHLIKGWYSLERASAPRYVQPPDKTNRVDIWRLEEKETDVNIALHLYRDALRNECDQLLLISNDSDLLPALKWIRHDAPQQRLGIVFPISEQSQARSGRPFNQLLSEQADWTRHVIRDEELQRAQLPARIPTAKKPIIKPDYW
jgi:uncharacterized LabA/DUF88 family protein